jgi:hypothetical protein
MAREKLANARRLAKMQHDETFAALEGFGFSFTKKTRPASRQSATTDGSGFNEDSYGDDDGIQVKFKYMLLGGR